MYLNILLLPIIRYSSTTVPHMNSESTSEIPAKKLNRKIPSVFLGRRIEKKSYTHRCDR